MYFSLTLIKIAFFAQTILSGGAVPSGGVVPGGFAAESKTFDEVCGSNEVNINNGDTVGTHGKLCWEPDYRDYFSITNP